MAEQTVITVCSGKGGVGKSVVSANLALSLMHQGSVVLWDADAQFPNQHIMFGVEPAGRVHDVYRGLLTLDKALHRVQPSLWLLAGKTGTDTEAINAQSVMDVFKDVQRTRAEFVVIDAAAGSGNDTLQACTLSDIVLIVITDEPTSVIDAYGLMKILKRYMPLDRIHLVVNNAVDADDADDVAQKLNAALKKFLNTEIPFLGFVPYDRAVRTSIIDQKPLLLHNAESDAAVALKKLAATVHDSVVRNV